MASSSLTTAYLVLAGAVIAAVAMVVITIQPLVRDIGVVRGDISLARARLVEREDFLRTLDAKVAALARESQHERQLNVVLPVADEHQDVVRIIHQAGIASGGVVRQLNNISPGVQSNLNARRARGEEFALPGNVAPLGFSIDFAGSYQQLRVFLDQLVRAPRLLDIVSLEIRRSDQALDTVSAVMTVHFYRYQPQE